MYARFFSHAGPRLVVAAPSIHCGLDGSAPVALHGFFQCPACASRLPHSLARCGSFRCLCQEMQRCSSTQLAFMGSVRRLTCSFADGSRSRRCASSAAAAALDEVKEL